MHPIDAMSGPVYVALCILLGAILSVKAGIRAYRWVRASEGDTAASGGFCAPVSDTYPVVHVVQRPPVEPCFYDWAEADKPWEDR